MKVTRKIMQYIGTLIGIISLCCVASCKDNKGILKWGGQGIAAYVDKNEIIHFQCDFRSDKSVYTAEVKFLADGSISTESRATDLILRTAIYTKLTEYIKYYVFSSQSFVLFANDGNGWKETGVVDQSYLLSSLVQRKYATTDYQELNEKIVRDVIGVNDTCSVSIGASPVVDDVMYNDIAFVSVVKNEISSCYLANYDGTQWSFSTVPDGNAMVSNVSGYDAELVRWGTDYIPCVTATSNRYDLTGYLKYDSVSDSFSYAAFSDGYKKIFKMLSKKEDPFHCEPVITSDGRVHYIQYNGDAFTASYVIYDPSSAMPETPVWEKKLF